MLVAGLLATGGAVALRPGSPLLVAAAGIVALVGAWGLRPWDTACSVAVILAGLAFFSAALLALPALLGVLFLKLSGGQGVSTRQVEHLQQRGQFAGRLLSRGIVSLLAVVHFSGIASAFLSVPPPGRDASWLAQGVWTMLQPYLQFCYLTNAYRFYSPEPGPPSLLWFHIDYADGSSRWLKLPTRELHRPDPLGQEYTRRLSIAESVSQLDQMQVLSDEVRRRRLVAGQHHDIPLLNMQQQTVSEIPSVDLQWRKPNDASRKLLGEFARFVAANYPSEKDLTSPVTGIKIYRVVHRILEPRELADPSSDAVDPTTYWPYYQGDFDRDGKLKDADDPYLYWLLPIYRQPRTAQPDLIKGLTVPPVSPGGYILRNCLDIHVKLPTKREGNEP